MRAPHLGLALLLAPLCCEAADDLGCDERAKAYLSEVDSKGLHVVCLHTPWRSEASTSPPAQVTASVYYNSLASTLETHRLDTADEGNAASIASDQLLARLTARLGADWLKRNPHLSVGLFTKDGRPVLDDSALLGQGGAAAAGHVLFAFDSGRFQWPAVRIGHVWNVTLESQATPLRLRTLSLRPSVFAMEGFLSPQEAELIQTLASPYLARSGVANTDGSGENAADVRTSSNTFLSRGHGSNAEIEALEHRVHALTRTYYEEGENIQVVRYDKHQMYEAHWDYFDPRQYTQQPDVIKRMDLWRRNRLATVFWYLNSLPSGAGGETFFPRALDGAGESITEWRYDYKSCDQGIKYEPTAGHALLFYSQRPDGVLEEHSLHGGCPVLDAAHTKWGANLWVWSKDFVSLDHDGARDIKLAQEEQWREATDPADQEGTAVSSFLYCQATGRRVLSGEGKARRGEPAVGARCTGSRSWPAPLRRESGDGDNELAGALQEMAAADVEVTLTNDTPSRVSVALSSQTEAGERAEALSSGSSMTLTVPSSQRLLVNGKSLRMDGTAGQAQLLLASDAAGKAGRGRKRGGTKKQRSEL